MSENLIPIPGRLHSVASEGHVAGANEIFDDNKNKLQSTINAEVDTELEKLDDAAYIAADSGSAVIPSFDPQADTLHKAAQTLSSSEKAQVKANLGLDGDLSGLQNSILAEATARANAVSAEQSRAQGAESSLQSSISAEATARANAVSAEASRAQAVESALQNNIEALTQSNIVVVADHTSVSNPDPITIYREQGTNTYSDWMYQNGSWNKMAEYDNAIDDEPTAGSDNLVKSGGVEEQINRLDNEIYDVVYEQLVQIEQQYGIISKTDGAFIYNAYHIIHKYLNNGFQKINAISTTDLTDYATIAFYSSNEITASSFINCYTVEQGGEYNLTLTIPDGCVLICVVCGGQYNVNAKGGTLNSVNIPESLKEIDDIVYINITTDTIDYSNLPEDPLVIAEDGSNVYTTYLEARAKYVPISQYVGQKLTFDPSIEGLTVAFLTSSVRSKGASVPYCSGQSFIVLKGIEEYIVPNDASYLYVVTKTGDGQSVSTIIYSEISREVTITLKDAYKELDEKVEDASFSNTIYVASYDSSYKDRNRADIVIVNNFVDTINSILRSATANVLTIIFLPGTYIIDKFSLVSEGYYGAILVPHNVTAKQFNLFAWHNSDMINPSVKFVLSSSVYETLNTSDVYSIIRQDSIDPLNEGADLSTHLAMRGIMIDIYDNQRKIIGIDLFWSGGCNIEDCTVRASQRPESWSNVPSDIIPIEGCIGIRGLQGSRNSSAAIRKCYTASCYIGIAVSGEHLRVDDCASVRCYYGFAFNYFPQISQKWYVHPMIITNCAEELCMNLPYFGYNSPSQNQSVIISNFHTEQKSGPFSQGGHYATEMVPGSWRGCIDYVIQKFSENVPLENAVDIPFWADGNGSQMRSVNAAQKQICTSEERNSYAANYMQCVLDSTINKIVYCKEPANNTWIDSQGNVI